MTTVVITLKSGAQLRFDNAEVTMREKPGNSAFPDFDVNLKPGRHKIQPIWTHPDEIAAVHLES